MTFLTDPYQFAAAPGVLDTTAFTANDITSGATSEAYVEFNTDGSATLYGSLGASPADPRWWTNNAPPATWVSYTSTGIGTIIGGLVSGTRYQINVVRKVGIARGESGIAARTFTFSFYDAASGGTLLGTKTFDAYCEWL